MNCDNKLFLRWEEKKEKVFPQEKKIKHKGKGQTSLIQKIKKPDLQKGITHPKEESKGVPVREGEKSLAKDPKVEIQNQEIDQEEADLKNLIWTPVWWSTLPLK